MAQVLRVGVIGCGGIAQMMHLPFLAERPDRFEIAALSDVRGEVLEAVARRYGVARRYLDYRELLRDAAVDAVLILSGDSHRQPVIDAARAGKPIFVEKPLAESRGDLDAIAGALAESRVPLLVGYHKRYDPAYLAARERVAGMADLRFVQVTVLHPVDADYRQHHRIEPPGSPEELAAAHDEARDGLHALVTSEAVASRIRPVVGDRASAGQMLATFMLFNSLIHDVNAVRGVLGEPERVVHAQHWHGGRAIHAVLAFGRDVRCALSWIYLPGLMHYREELLFAGPSSRVVLTFPSPYLRHAPTSLLVEETGAQGLVQSRITPSYEEAFRAELHHFYQVVTAGERPLTDLADARGDTLVLEQMARACVETK
ncbi:MAG: Gfo/Idh/MocA family oxidoreductase [Deltaproteobacteria bacterium]|nr:Gfo/Idh/MocA family oxidoreductase [Deltaproteobacteria bacterium]